MPNASARGQTGPRLRLCAILIAAFACALVMFGLPDVSGAGSGQPERTDGAPASAPQQPIGSRSPRPVSVKRPGLRIRLSADRLLAGAPGQRLRVRARSSAAAGPELTARLVRRAREDARRPGTMIAREVVAQRSSVNGRLALEPGAVRAGSYRLVLSVEPDSRPPRRIEVPLRAVPQSRFLLIDEPVRAPARLSAHGQNRERLAIKQGTLNADLAFTPGSQASSAIAVPAGNPDRAIAASGDAEGAIEVLVSDRGLRVGSEVVRDFPDTALEPGGGERSIDPCCAPGLAAGPGGDLWAATSSDGTGSRILVGRIPAGADAFAGPAVALPVAPGADLQEKPAIAVSATRAAVAWVETVGPDQNVVVSECQLTTSAACDDPDAWSAPVPATASSGLYSLPDVELGPAGELIVVWWDAGPDNAVEGSLCVAAPPCGPAGFAAETTIEALDSLGGEPLPLFCPIIAAPGGYVGPSPTVVAGPSGSIHVSYSDLRANADPADPTRCTATGTDATFDSFVATGAAPGQLPVAGSGIRLSSDAADAVNDHFLPALAVDPADGTVEASWYTTVSDPGGQFTERVYAASTDGGLTFSEPIAISTDRSRFAGSNSDGIDYGDRQGAASADGVFRAVWTDGRAIQGRDADLYGLVDPSPLSITSAPPGLGESPLVTVEFATEAPRAECAVDAGGWEECRSPLELGPLGNGDHRVRIRPTDAVGNQVANIPAEVTFTVLDSDPPETFITERPPARTQLSRPLFVFAADEAGAIFQCSYDGEDWRRCRESKQAKVSRGRHVFRVRAIDVGGNVDPTPAVTRFRRDGRCTKQRERRGVCERPD